MDFVLNGVLWLNSWHAVPPMNDPTVPCTNITASNTGFAITKRDDFTAVPWHGVQSHQIVFGLGGFNALNAENFFQFLENFLTSLEDFRVELNKY